MSGEPFRRSKRSFWNRSKNDYKTSKHLKLDKLAAKKKLQLLTSTDLYLKNSLECYRVSNFGLFKLNLLNSSVWISTSLLFLFCNSITESALAFALLFSCLIVFLNYHLESVESFARIQRNVEYLDKNEHHRNKLLETYLGLTPKDEKSERDSFIWINKIFDFFWPYLSHLIHFELNQFFKEQIESGSLANSVESSKRLFYAFLRQLDSRVLVVERFQLGKQPPRIKRIAVEEKLQEKPVAEAKDRKKERTVKKGLKVAVKKVVKVAEARGLAQQAAGRASRAERQATKAAAKSKTLVFDLEFDYNGDMNMSVIYRYLCCCSSRFGLEDVYLNLKARLIVGPFKEELPFVEQLSLTLLELPQFGYKGIALVELAELKIVRSVLNRLATENILFPKCLTVSFGEFLQRLSKESDRYIEYEEKQNSLKKVVSEEQPGASKALTKTHKEVSMSARLMARALLCSCMMANLLLRGCQRKVRPASSSRSSSPASSRSSRAPSPRG